MFPFFFVLQAAPDAVPPPPPPPPPAAAAPYPYPYPYAQPAPYAAPYPYGYGQPYAYPPPAPPPPPPPPERPTEWFVRIDVGLGPPAFSEETRLLRLEGYGGAKFWAGLDGAYMFHENVGVGAWGALSYWSSTPTDAPTMTENAYLFGGEVPLKLGSRAIALIATARLGYATGQVQFAGDAPFQGAFAFGGDVSVTSFKAHLSLSLGLLHAGVGPPGRVGRSHDYGGLYFSIGGVIDG